MFDTLKNIFKPNDERRALEFWTWFDANERHYRDMDEDGPKERDHRIKIFLDHLASYHYELTFLTGRNEDGTYELTISADGVQKNFKDVEVLVANAPTIKGWRFIALKPADPKVSRIVLNDKTFALENMQFARIQSPEADDKINIAIFHPPYTKDEQEIHVVATYMLLDSLLGERSAAENLSSVDVRPLNEEVPQNVLRPLLALPRLIADHKLQK